MQEDEVKTSESVVDLPNSTIPIEEPKVVKNFKVTKKKMTKLTHDGIADDFVNASVEGKEIGKYRKKSLYKDTDTVEDMADSTIELISDSSRKILKKMEETENETINELLAKTYAPREKRKTISEKKMVEAVLNIV